MAATHGEVIATRDALGEQLAQLDALARDQAIALARIEAQIQALAGQTVQTAPKLFTTVFDDTELLPHFLSHYANAGVREFYIAAPAERKSDIEHLVSNHAVTVCSADVSDSYIVGQATAAMHQIRERYQGEEEWSLIVDLDEFIALDQSIPEIIASAEAEGANVVKGVLYDRFAADGRTTDPKPGKDLAQQYPVRARFITEVMLGYDHKAVLVKGRLQGPPEFGQHILEGERVASKTLQVDHYKWTEGSIDRLRERCRGLEEVGIEWRIQYERMIQHYERNGRFVWEQFGGELSRPDREFLRAG